MSFAILCGIICAACLVWRKQGYDSGYQRGYRDASYACMVAQTKKDQQNELID